MKAKNLEDLVVYNEALVAEDAVSALLDRPGFSTDLNLRGQLDRSSSRIAPLIAEGFGQLTDRHVATYLARARIRVGNQSPSAEGGEDEVHHLSRARLDLREVHHGRQEAIPLDPSSTGVGLAHSRLIGLIGLIGRWSMVDGRWRWSMVDGDGRWSMAMVDGDGDGR